MAIPEAIRRRTPLMTPAWYENLRRLREHPHAPRWNSDVGDRLTAEDLAACRAYARRLDTERRPQDTAPPGDLVAWMRDRQKRSAWFAERIAGRDPARDFAAIPPMTRGDLRHRLADIVPADADLTRLIVNPTAGTTGMPLAAPSHPRAQGCYDPLIQFALARHGLRARYDHTVTAAVQVCAQRETIVYAAVHAYLDGAGFAKVNLRPDCWPSPQSPVRYIEALAPLFLSGDPFAYERLLDTGIACRPGAILSTALAMDDDLRRRLTERFQSPVVEIYSSNETGPLAYSAPGRPGWYHVLPVDIYLEIIDEEGSPLPDGVEGEIAVTGGRNPYLPLLRYRTGDRGVMLRRHEAGDPLPLVRLTKTRRLVIFDIPGGGYVNPADVARIMRRHAVERFRCRQGADGGVHLRLAPGGFAVLDEDLRRDLALLFENRCSVTVTRDLDAHDRGEPYMKEDS